jgi:hypothetical protein
LLERNSIFNGLQALHTEDMHTRVRRLPTPDIMVEDLKVIRDILILMKEEEKKDGRRMKRDVGRKRSKANKERKK